MSKKRLEMKEGSRIKIKDGKQEFFAKVNEVGRHFVNVLVYRKENGQNKNYTAELPHGKIVEVIRL